MERLTEALAALPEDQYQAINLHFLQGLPLAEVAHRMGGRSRPSIAGLVRRGLDVLRERLGDFDCSESTMATTSEDERQRRIDEAIADYHAARDAG